MVLSLTDAQCEDVLRHFWGDEARWFGIDPMADKYPDVSPYVYCEDNPLMYVDPDGEWSIEVHASSDRGKYPYAIYQVFDKNNNLIFQTVVKVRGQHRKREETYGDTPTGEYKLNYWRRDSGFGKNEFIDQTYMSGEAHSTGRDRMHTHGGGDVTDENGKLQGLRGTNGCIRMTDDDLVVMKIITDYLQICDPSEIMKNLTIQNDLEEPIIDFKQKREELTSINYYCLPEMVVCPKNDNEVDE